MQNEFVFRNEYVFVMFDDILRSIAPSILKLLKAPSYRNGFSSYIDYSKFENLTDTELNYFCMKRTHRNILDEVKLTTFDTEKTLADILSRHKGIYTNTPNMQMMYSINILMKQSFTKKLYIYSEEESSDIESAVVDMFDNVDNAVFVTGDFRDVISKIEESITLYILNDVSRLTDIIECGKVKFTDILIANYGYNYTYDEEQQIPVLRIQDLSKLSKDEIFRLNMFFPFTKDQLDVIKHD